MPRLKIQDISRVCPFALKGSKMRSAIHLDWLLKDLALAAYYTLNVTSMDTPSLGRLLYPLRQYNKDKLNSFTRTSESPSSGMLQVVPPRIAVEYSDES